MQAKDAGYGPVAPTGSTLSQNVAVLRFRGNYVDLSSPFGREVTPPRCTQISGKLCGSIILPWQGGNPVCTLYIPSMYPLYTLCAPCMYPLYTLYVSCMYPLYTLYVPSIYTIYALCMYPLYTLYVPCMYPPDTLYVPSVMHTHLVLIKHT